nr:hypothetical protein [Rhizobium laguerreae]
MGFGRNLIQTAFLCGALAMPVLARGAEVSAEDALLTRLSIETVPRLQREYLRATLTPQDEGTAIDVAAYVLSKTLIGGMSKVYSMELFRGFTRQLRTKCWSPEN